MQLADKYRLFLLMASLKSNCLNRAGTAGLVARLPRHLSGIFMTGLAKRGVHVEIRDFIIMCFAPAFWVIGILAEILNLPTFEKLLSKLNIPLNFDQYLLVAYISLAILFISICFAEVFYRIIFVLLKKP